MLAYVVELVDDELEVLPIHRLVSGLPDGYDLLGALAGHFTATDAGAVTADMADRLVRRRRPRPGHPGGGRGSSSPGPTASPAGATSTRAASTPPSRPSRSTSCASSTASTRCVAAVADGEAQAGFLLRPATVGQIVDIAHGGERMPPKTTFFSPKPRTGVVFRLLDE